jgi:hypothetical protein
MFGDIEFMESDESPCSKYVVRVRSHQMATHAKGKGIVIAGLLSDSMRSEMRRLYCPVRAAHNTAELSQERLVRFVPDGLLRFVDRSRLHLGSLHIPYSTRPVSTCQFFLTASSDLKYHQYRMKHADTDLSASDLGRLGAAARMAALPPRRRVQIARQANKARWDKYYKDHPEKKRPKRKRRAS